MPPGAPFPPGSTDLQSWIRNAALDPDWLRVGTDITHQGPFNAVFSLSGDTVAAVPEPETYALLLIGFAAMGVRAPAQGPLSNARRPCRSCGRRPAYWPGMSTLLK